MKPFFLNSSIKTKIIVGVIVVLLFALGGISLMNYTFSQKRERKEVLDNELPMMLDGLYSNIKADFSIPLTVASLIASNPYTFELLAKEQPNQTKIMEYLQNLQETYSRRNEYTLTTFIASDTSLTRYDGTGMLEQIKPKERQAAWYFDLKNSRKDHTLQTNFREGSFMIFIDMAIRDSSQNFKGVAGVGFYLNDFVERINTYRFYKKAEIYFVDKDGYIKIHSKKRLIQNDTSEQKLAERSIRNIKGISQIADELLKNPPLENGSEYKNSNGKTILARSRFISELDWFLIVEVEEHEVLEGVYDDLRLNLLIYILAGGVVIVLLIVTLDILVVRQLRKFTKGVFAFFDFLNRKTDYVEPIDIHTNDEFGRMSAEINHQIEQTIHGIERDDALIQDAAELVAVINKGLLSERLKVEPHQPKLLDLKTQFNQMIEHLENQIGTDINEIVEVMQRYGKMNFEKHITNPQGEIEKQITQMGENIETATEQIQKQKAEIAERNQKITDSIRYAESIQKALLPKTEAIAEGLPQHFIFLKPKDIVSGDFYWYGQTPEKVFLVAADCTGHGVPGALMSMIGNSFFNHIINEKRIYEPSEILENLHQGIIQTLNQEQMENDDGMDLVLCVFDRSAKSPHFENIAFAGAKNALITVSNGQATEHKGSRKKIGGISRKKDIFFETVMIPIQQEMSIYLFSDGFEDQFGNMPKEKYGRERLKELFVRISPMNMIEQRTEVQQSFENWVGEGQHAQLDDVLVMGLKILK